MGSSLPRSREEQWEFGNVVEAGMDGKGVWEGWVFKRLYLTGPQSSDMG